MNKISVQIPDACSEKWETFVVRDDGRLCQSCNKVVVDFTSMNDREIVDYLVAHSGRVCGRLAQHQLKVYSFEEAVVVRPGFGLLKAGFVSLFLLITASPILATTKEVHPVEISLPATEDHGGTGSIDVVEGRVVSMDDGAALPGVNVMFKGATIGTVTDTEGRFKLDGLMSNGDTLTVSFIGYKTAEYAVRGDRASYLEIALEADVAQLTEVVVVAGMISVGYVNGDDGEKKKTFWQRFKRMFSRS